MNVPYAKFQKKFESRTISRELPQLRNVSKEIFIARKTESAVVNVGYDWPVTSLERAT